VEDLVDHDPVTGWIRWHRVDTLRHPSSPVETVSPPLERETPHPLDTAFPVASFMEDHESSAVKGPRRRSACTSSDEQTTPP
jgi:hypothetical protein